MAHLSPPPAASHVRTIPPSNSASLRPLAAETGERIPAVVREEARSSLMSQPGAAPQAEGFGPVAALAGGESLSASGAYESGRMSPFPASPAPPAAQEQLIHATLARMQVVRSVGESEFELRLTPPELGTLRVALRQSRQGLVVRVLAEELSTQQLLQSVRTEILAALDRQQPGGLELSLETRSDGRPHPEPEELPSGDGRTAAVPRTTSTVRAPPPATLSFLA